MKKFVLFLSTLFLLTFVTDVGAKTIGKQNTEVQKQNPFTQVVEKIASNFEICTSTDVGWQNSFSINEQKQILTNYLFATSTNSKNLVYTNYGDNILKRKMLSIKSEYNLRNKPLHRFPRGNINTADHC